MTDIELRNENGKIVGYDSDGNKVPVSFEDGSFDTLDTDDATITTSSDGEAGITFASDAAQLAQYLLSVDIREAGAGSADYNFVKFDKNFNGTIDHITKFGYNITPANTREDASESQMVHTIESKYENGGGDLKTEQHFEGQYPDGTPFRTLSNTVRWSPSKEEISYLAADRVLMKGPSKDGQPLLAEFDGQNEKINFNVPTDSNLVLGPAGNTSYQLIFDDPNISGNNGRIRGSNGEVEVVDDEGNTTVIS